MTEAGASHATDLSSVDSMLWTLDGLLAVLSSARRSDHQEAG
jgi:hypothetical protein